MNKKGQASLNDLPKLAFILLLAGIFFAIALVIMGTFKTQTYDTGNVVTSEAFVVPLSNTSVNGSVTLANANMESFTSVTNGSVTLPAANYSISLSTGVLTIVYQNNHSTTALCRNGTTCYASYVYTDRTTSGSASVDSTITALSEIPNNWLALLVVVLVASILVGIVVQNLGNVGGRN